MLTSPLLDRFLETAAGQAQREGARYARESRVARFIGSPESVTTVVRGATGEYDVLLWADRGTLEHRCSCPSWRDPCKHEVAAALALRTWLRKLEGLPAEGTAASRRAAPPNKPGGRRLARAPEPADARAVALAERVRAAADEKAKVRLGAPGRMRVESGSGFAYDVVLRGGADGPHGCNCPDFEANRLHTCKHVERVRRELKRPRFHLPPEHQAAADRPRVYLRFGEIVEPRLHGRPAGPGAAALREAFDTRGLPLASPVASAVELLERLHAFGSRVEPEALGYLERRAARRPELPEGDFRALLPKLRLEPYPYQLEGAAFLARTGRALLADEMGLGKTVQAILAAAALRNATPPVRRVTIVCPASLRGGWADEIGRWLGEEATPVEGTAVEREQAIAAGAPWLVTHYEQLVRDFRAHRDHPPDLLIIDEAQRAKGLGARTARVLKAIDARHVYALTGTPLENRLEEAYAIAQLIDQRLLPPLWQLDRDHFVRDDDGRRVVFYRDLGTLRSRLAPAFLRRRKEDVALQLPERVRSTVFVPLHEKVLPTYGDVMSQVAQIAARKVIPPAELERMQRLLVIARRCCNGPHMLGLDVASEDVPKLAELEQVLRDLCLGEGRKAVVFSEWTDMTERVERLCQGLGLQSFHLHGGVRIADRPELIRAFREAPGPAVFVSTDAGGVGLNLQAADVVVSLDLPWNPSRLEQRIARVHRIGSGAGAARTVQVVLLVARGAIEEHILHLHATKENVLANVWAKDGEDTIAAPGGGHAFRAMVAALVDSGGTGSGTTPPARLVLGDAVADGSRVARDAGAAAIDAEVMDVEVVAEARPAPAARFQLPAADRGDDGSAARPQAPVPVLAVAEGVPAPATTSAPSGGRSDAGPAVAPEVLVRAVASIAPALPAEHRKSLATALRALAEALEG